jgi:hypothetical protein
MRFGFTVARMAALVVCALGFAAGSATAQTDVQYNGWGMTEPNPVIVTLNYNNGSGIISEEGYAGLLTLDTTSLGQLPVWCLDIYDYLGNSGDYVVSRLNLGGLDSPQDRAIAALMTQGGAVLASGNTPAGASLADVSAAIQIAIWDEEYASDPSLALSITPDSDTTVVNGLVSTYLTNVSGNNPAWTVPAGAYVATLTQTGNQSMGYDPTPAPEPASLTLFGTAVLGLLGLRRRRR